MILMLVRHGQAEDVSADGSDFSRALTDDGIRATELAMRGLAKFADRPDVILTSPLTRAVQTAEIAGRAFGRTPETMKELGGSDLSAIIAELSARPEVVVMIVGHEPTFSHLVSTLCSQGRCEAFVDFKKAGCACLTADLNTGSAELRWFVTSKILRLVAQ